MVFQNGVERKDLVLDDMSFTEQEALPRSLSITDTVYYRESNFTHSLLSI